MYIVHTCTQAVFKSPPFAHHILYSPTENDVYLLMNRVIQFVFFSPARIFLQKEFDHMPSTMIKRFFISIPFVVITHTSSRLLRLSVAHFRSYSITTLLISANMVCQTLFIIFGSLFHCCCWVTLSATVQVYLASYNMSSALRSA